MKTTSRRSRSRAPSSRALVRAADAHPTTTIDATKDKQEGPDETVTLAERDLLKASIARAKKAEKDLRNSWKNLAVELKLERDEGWFRAVDKNFGRFVTQTFGYSRAWTYRLIGAYEASQVIEAAGHNPLPLSDLFPVIGLEPEEQLKAYLEAKTASEGDGEKQPSRKRIAEAAAARKGPKKPRKAKVETEDEEPAPAKRGPKASHPDKAAAERLTEIAKELEKIPRGGLNNEARRDKLEEERAALEAGLQGKAAEKERAKTNGNGSAKKSVLLTAHEVKARIAAWLKSELTTEQRNKSQPVWKTAERIKDLF